MTSETNQAEIAENRTIYQELRDLGVEIDSHEGDLYVPNTPEVRAVIERRRSEGETIVAEPFKNELNGQPWLDIAFRYDPYYESGRGAPPENRKS